MRIEESITIGRPPEEVFAFLEVRSHDSAWMASVVKSEWLEPAESDTGAPRIGRRGQMVMKVPGRRTEYIDEVTRYEPGRLVAHRVVEGPIQLNTACITEPAPSGCRATVMAETAQFIGGAFGKLANPLLAKIVRRGFKADLARLKQIMETRPSAIP